VVCLINRAPARAGGNGSNGSAAFPGAWARQRDARNITVCIIDTGLDVTHPDLAANLWVNPGEVPGNGIDDDSNGVVDDVHGFNGVDGSGNITVRQASAAVARWLCVLAAWRVCVRRRAAEGAGWWLHCVGARGTALVARASSPNAL